MYYSGNKLSEEAAAIIKLANDTGGFPSKMIDMFDFRNMENIIKFLSIRRYIEYTTDSRFISPKIGGMLNSNICFMTWVLLDIIKNGENKVSVEALKSYFVTDKPVKCFLAIVNDEDIYKITYIDEQNISSLHYIQHYHESRPDKEKEKITYILTVGNKDVVNKIVSGGFIFPYKIAFIAGDISDNPSIEYITNQT